MSNWKDGRQGLATDYSPAVRLLLSGTVPDGGEALFQSILGAAHGAEFPIHIVHGAHPSVVPLIGEEWRGRDRACILYSSERWPAPSGPHGPGVRIPVRQDADPTNDLVQLRRRMVVDADKMLIFGGRIPPRGHPSGVADEMDAAYLGDRRMSLQVVICGWFGGAAGLLAGSPRRTTRRGYPYLSEEEAALIAAPEMTDAGFAALRRWLTMP